MTSGRQAFIDATDVSRETLSRLDTYAELLTRWTRKINLVSSSSVHSLWERHFLDSAQLLKFAPQEGLWVDLGSGGGFPGAVLAILAREHLPDLNFVLVESDARKAAFLRTVARECGADFKVRSERIESLPGMDADVLSARALASLSDLLGFAEQHLKPEGVAIFPKGAKADAEIATALERWSFDCETYPSETDEEAVILKIGAIERV